MHIEACVFNLSQLGELTTKLDEDFKPENPQVAWAQIYGLRNRIVHDYDGVKFKSYSSSSDFNASGILPGGFLWLEWGACPLFVPYCFQEVIISCIHEHNFTGPFFLETIQKRRKIFRNVEFIQIVHEKKAV